MTKLSPFNPTSKDLPKDSGICKLNKFALFEGPDITDITDKPDPGCPEAIDKLEKYNQQLKDEGKKPLNAHFYFLSEIEDLIGGCQNLPCFLKAIANTKYSNATLIIDKVCHLSEPLIIPSRFTLAGVGIDGEGKLEFDNLPDGVSAICLDKAATNITIRDLAIGRVGGGVNIGIDVSRANKVFIRDVIVTGFFAGIYGSRPGWLALSVYVDRSSIFGNDYNIVMHRNAFHWRIRDCILNQAKCWGLLIFGKDNDPVPPPENNMGWGNDYLISGCRFEGSGIGGALLGSHAAMLMNNRFEQNGGVGGVGVKIQPSATGTRMVSNVISGNQVLDTSKKSETQRWGDIETA
ncbi:hypothetical protein QUB60_02755 [Microcoleus sp. A2-C5]|uniref:hypothetical protein n=1 Tax=Microcoleaceae TaxID=1892252 RepID=UPI002238B419|nr:hypothetical protein [Lyngbya sp. CCAP 1446/10]MCW6050440.1 hypothetical protein [Lyngbya sp. CCAP 1446/10]